MNEELFNKIKKLRFDPIDTHLEGSWHDQGYNNAIDDVLKLLKMNFTWGFRTRFSFLNKMLDSMCLFIFRNEK